ncbi:MAG: HNH endonuclease [Pseudomonadota bacterium]
MRARALHLMRLALATDALASDAPRPARTPGADLPAYPREGSAAGAIATRCLHCRTPLLFAPSGASLNGATLEHVVPRSWFGRGAARELTAGLDGPDDPRNLAPACAACNHAKGRGPDARGPGDARARAAVAGALARRLERWRPAPAAAPRGARAPVAASRAR